MSIPPYQQLELCFKRLSTLSEVEAILHWDMSTVMPVGGAKARAEQLAKIGPALEQ